jgi:hypothetical protein
MSLVILGIGTATPPHRIAQSDHGIARQMRPCGVLHERDDRRKAGKPAYVIINAAPVQGVETAEAIAAITAAGVDVCPVVLHHRKPYASRTHEGRTAQEIEPKGKAAAEIQALLKWICEQVILLPMS